MTRPTITAKHDREHVTRTYVTGETFTVAVGCELTVTYDLGQEASALDALRIAADDVRNQIEQTAKETKP